LSFDGHLDPAMIKQLEALESLAWRCSNFVEGQNPKFSFLPPRFRVWHARNALIRST
jgi:hypothetical protein